MTDVLFAEGLSSNDISSSGFKVELKIDTTPNQGNARSAWRKLEKSMNRETSEIEKDILDIAEAIYLADRHILRTEGVEYARRIRILMPLRNPDVFDSQRISSLLRNLAMDSVTFEITKKKGIDEKTEFTEKEEESERDIVCLVSGGVDSFGGVIDAYEQDFNPIMVSHFTSDSSPQESIGKALERNYGNDISHLKIGNLKVSGRCFSKKVKDPKEKTMRLRSFLYLSLASVVASNNEILDVRMSENGIMTAAIPFSSSRIGPYTTKTTHPRYVTEFANWFQTVTGHKIQISNPFRYNTKSEIVKEIGDRGFANDLKFTNSCFNRRGAVIKGSDHCGNCIPCIIRRTSFIGSGMEKYDCQNGYGDDFFSLNSISHEGKRNITDLSDFATDFSNMSHANLRIKYVDLYGLGDDKSINDTIDTLKRFSKEFLNTMKLNAEPALKKALGIN